MKKVRFVGTPAILFAIVFVGIAGLLTEGLWNLLMPTLLRLPAISFWQALGLLLLSRLLFGGLGGWGRTMRKARYTRGWSSLTREERQRFRDAMDSRRPANFGRGEAAEKV
jgi:Spy/CpxP family protein refolding chaperone